MAKAKISPRDGRWIPLSKKLPPEGVLVEVCFYGEHIARYRRDDAASESSVLHWVNGRRSTYSTGLKGVAWRYPNGAAPTPGQIHRIQIAWKARKTRLKNEELKRAEEHRRRERRRLRRKQREYEKLKCFRVRRYSGHKGGSNHYYHADILAKTWHEALRAAKEDRVLNWRRVDTFDMAEETYCRYEYLYQVDRCCAKHPRKPLNKREYAKWKKEQAQAHERWKQHMARRQRRAARKREREHQQLAQAA